MTKKPERGWRVLHECDTHEQAARLAMEARMRPGLFLADTIGTQRNRATNRWLVVGRMTSLAKAKGGES